MVLLLICFLQYLKMPTSRVLATFASTSILICTLFQTKNTNADLQGLARLGKICTLDNCEGPTVNDGSLKVEIISSLTIS